MKQYDEIILSGGNLGTNSFLGCLQCLVDLENVDLNKTKCWIGTSGGAIISLLMALNYDPLSIKNVIKQIPISKICSLSSDKWLNFFDQYGLHDTNDFKKVLKIFLEHKNYSSNITFFDFYKETTKQLVFTSFCLNTESIVILDYEKTPELSIIDGLMMSIAVPFLFKPISYQNRLYVDAFLIANCPSEFSRYSNSISLNLVQTKSYNDTIDIISYIRILLRSSLDKIQYTCQKAYSGQSIQVPCNYNFDASFNIDPEIFEKFYLNGYIEMKKHLNISKQNSSTKLKKKSLKSTKTK